MVSILQMYIFVRMRYQLPARFLCLLLFFSRRNQQELDSN